MQRIVTSLPGVYELRPLIHCDLRDCFLESHHYTKFTDLWVKDTFPQDILAVSFHGTLHYQLVQQHFLPRHSPR